MTRIAGYLIAVMAVTHPLRAVENISNGTFPAATSSTPDANYVGQVNGASGTYLGNGFVLTVAHVGAGNFLLDGTTYDLIPGSAMGFQTNEVGFTGTADLTLFRISLANASATLPSTPLTLASTPPMALSPSNQGSSVELVGFGGSSNSIATFGNDTVTDRNQDVTLSAGAAYKSIDFFTENGTVTRGVNSATNNFELVPGDSGGGDFIAVGSQLELAGLNEAQLVDGTTGAVEGSAYVQLSDYSAQIEAAELADVPEPPSWLLAMPSLVAIVFFAHLRSFAVR